MHKVASLGLAGFLFAASFAQAEGIVRDSELTPPGALPNCYERNIPLAQSPVVDQGILRRIISYTQIAVKHRVNGLASYYSSFFDGRKTANGEIFRNGKYSAAHLTLPLGTWVEVTSRATGRKLRMRVNDRGPYAKKFCLDLSQAAAKYLGVDVARDRYVHVRIIGLPGEEPIPDDIDLASLELPEIESEADSRSASASQ
jgi:rare lipoprotein A